MDINKDSLFPIVPTEILRASGTVVYFLSQDGRVYLLDLLVLSMKTLKQYALLHIESVYVDVSGLC